jgi:hypothetical protein
MSGIGTSGVEALWLDRQYIGIELEDEYCDLQEKNLKLAESQGARSDWRLIKGDAQTMYGIRDVDLITFSPPYQDAIHSQGNELARIRMKIDRGEASPELVRRFANWNPEGEQAKAGTRSNGYSANPANIGHKKGITFLEAMKVIYQRSFESLRPGGYLAVVTKDQRDRKTGQLTNMYGDTVELCCAAGFQLHQHIVAVLCKINEETGEVTHRTSHWQRMAVQRSLGTDRVILLGQFEDIAVFRRPLPS